MEKKVFAMNRQCESNNDSMHWPVISNLGAKRLPAGSFNYVEVVDETRTSNINRGYHAEAAIKIAGYDGES